MIASRGGLAPPEAPFVIEHREALIYMLCQAAELEHGIMCQYLYAAFSLKQSQDEGLTAEEEAAVKRWRKQISHVATQEMLHLSLVQNLLSAIGAAPHLSRPNFPQPARHYPAGVHLALLPFGDQALRHFMFLERPEGMDLEDADGMAAFGRPRRAGPCSTARSSRAARTSPPWGTCTGPSRPGSRTWRRSTVSGGCSSARRGRRPPSSTSAGPSWSRSPTWPRRSGPSTRSWSRARARAGTGKTRTSASSSAILDEYMQLREANPAFDPVRPVAAVNVRPAERETDIPLVSDPVARRVMDLFNVSYEILLPMLQRFFAHTEETDPQLKALADATVALMFGAIKPLGDLVTTLPAGPEYPGRTAGPSFELFYESDYVLPHREAAWILLTERIRQAAEFCEPGAPCDPAVTDGLAEVRSSLAGIADALAAHLPARYAPETPAPPEDLGTLLARAEDFYRTGQAVTPPGTSAPAGLAALLGSTYQAVRANQGDARTVARLVNSVLRPLAATLPPPAPQPNSANRPTSDPGPTPPPSATPPPSPPPPLPPRQTHQPYPQPRSPRLPCGTWPSPPPRCAPASVSPPRPACSRRSRRCRTWRSGRRRRASGPA